MHVAGPVEAQARSRGPSSAPLRTAGAPRYLIAGSRPLFARPPISEALPFTEPYTMTGVSVVTQFGYHAHAKGQRIPLIPESLLSHRGDSQLLVASNRAKDESRKDSNLLRTHAMDTNYPTWQSEIHKTHIQCGSDYLVAVPGSNSLLVSVSSQYTQSNCC